MYMAQPLYSWHQPSNFPDRNPDGFHTQILIIWLYHHFIILLSLVSILSSDLFVVGLRLKIFSVPSLPCMLHAAPK